MWRTLVPVLLLSTVAPLYAGDQVADARRLYNLGQYEEAARLAREAARSPATADGARVVLGRVYLERFRQSASSADLDEARAALRDVDPRGLDVRERVEYTVGLAEALFLEDRFGASAELFQSALGPSALLGGAARERVLDWWATAVDRLAQSGPPEKRGPLYQRIAERMTEELSREAGSTAAGYWVAAAARGQGLLDRAWSAAMAGWVRAPLARDRGAVLRGDLDRLVTQAIIPERAARLAPRDSAPLVAAMLGEWEAFKANWSR